MPENRSVAVIDLGSNAVRLAIGHHASGTPLPVVTRFYREVHTMGRDVFKTGTVSEKTIGLLARHFQQFKEAAEAADVLVVRAWGTSALRDATNTKEVQQHLLRVSGIYPLVLSGEQEAALSARALAAALPEGDVAGIDVGGGSTEICLIRQGLVQETASFNIGSSRLLKAHQPDRMLSDFLQHCLRFDTAEDVQLAATGGSADALVAVACRAAGLPENTRSLAIPDLEKAVALLTPLDPQARILHWGIEPTRADTIVMAGRILLAGASATHAQQLRLPGVGLIHGLLLACLEESGGTYAGNNRAEPESGPV